MMTTINYNAIDFKHFGYPECYISIIGATITFISLYMIFYYLLIPKMVHPYFQHIKSNQMLHWKIVDGLIASTHSISICILCFIIIDIISTTSDIISTYTTRKERVIASISIGYFIYDMITFCIIHSIKHTGKPHYIYLLHHLITIAGLSICILTVYGGRLLIIILFLNEITNPLLHINNIKNYFVSGDKRDNKCVLLIDFTMKTLYFISFSIMRFVIMTHIIYQIVFVIPCSVYIQIAGITFIILSILLLPTLLKDLSKTYAKYKNADNIQYSAVDEVSTTAMEMTENENEEFDENDAEIDTLHHNKMDEYNEILLLSQKSVTSFFVAGIVYSFFHTNRMSIYVLYAEEFNPTALQLAVLLYGANFWNGIASLLYGSLANQFGYDTVLVLLLVLQCVAVFLESIARSFYVLLLGIILGQVAITYIVFGYIAWILPNKDATNYTSYFYATFMVSYLIGPSSAGFISYYISNRTIFIINFIICFCALLHSYTFIAKTQKKMEDKQLMIGLMEEKEDNEQFPICLDRLKERNEEELEREIDNKWYRIPDLSYYEWFMLISIIYINATVSIADTAFIVYYAVYIIEDLKGNIIMGTCGVVLLSIAFMIGNIMVPKWFNSNNNDSENENESNLMKWLKNKYIVLILSLFILIFHTIFLFPYLKSLGIYYVYDITAGLALGVLSMTSEYIILEIQPTKHSGKVSGAKGLLRNFLIAITLLIISIYWEFTHNIFYFVISISFMIAVLCTMAMFYAKHKHQSIVSNEVNATDTE